MSTVQPVSVPATLVMVGQPPERHKAAHVALRSQVWTLHRAVGADCQAPAT